MAEEPMHPLVSVLPPDHREWLRLEVAAAQPESKRGQIIKLTVQVRDGVQKHLELVVQSERMIVYVNPDPLGFDEWELAASGKRFHVQSSGNVSAQA
jgi:hypothetical protein